MEEIIFFEYDDVKVTNARFLTNNQTYAMSNVTSVKPHKEDPNRLAGIIAIIVGLIFIMNESYLVGFIIIPLAVYIMSKQKTIYTVILKTSSGENRALQTYQQEYLNQVIDALNKAIVYRG
ncbi:MULTISPECIES: DUF6232 family protein [Shewanella]|uniref:DUF6232 family protein n=1 Tax=Shewanella septentrionalis TaxID=2952223 RepID=A0A9X2WYU9_9GAMM|nr:MULTISPECIES: DUF6232 family protein [Shewanella]AEG13638.1 QacE-like protein; integron orf [Shewanella baltica BA175]MCT7947935.1 DUF6232 family protein [Shewanella septentrionalis]